MDPRVSSSAPLGVWTTAAGPARGPSAARTQTAGHLSVRHEPYPGQVHAAVAADV